VEKQSQIHFDVSFNQKEGVIQTEIFFRANEKHPELKFLYMVTKVLL